LLISQDEDAVADVPLLWHEAELIDAPFVQVFEPAVHVPFSPANDTVAPANRRATKKYANFFIVDI
jgi:hypothetical protein